MTGSRPLNLLLLGTGPFAVPLFRSLLKSNYPILSLVTRPIEHPGQRRKSSPNPMRDCAVEQGIPVLDFPNVNAPEALAVLRQLAADLFIVCDYGQILSAECLSTARLGGLNLHGSLLPRYRGAAPVQWAIYHGESRTGVSVIHMTNRLDAGPVIESESVEIDPHETAGELEARLAQLGASVMLRALSRLERWDGVSALGVPQEPQQATTARRLRKSDGQVNWSRSAREIANQIRAFQPWPGSYTIIPAGSKEPLRLILLAASPLADDTQYRAQPGEVVQVGKASLYIQTGNGLLSVERVQPAGRNPQSIGEFLRGHAVTVGTRCLDDVPNPAKFR